MSIEAEHIFWKCANNNNNISIIYKKYVCMLTKSGDVKKNGNKFENFDMVTVAEGISTLTFKVSNSFCLIKSFWVPTFKFFKIKKFSSFSKSTSFVTVAVIQPPEFRFLLFFPVPCSVIYNFWRTLFSREIIYPRLCLRS